MNVALKTARTGQKAKAQTAAPKERNVTTLGLARSAAAQGQESQSASSPEGAKEAQHRLSGINIKRHSNSTQEPKLSEMSRLELKELLKAQGETGPKYMFSAVELATDTRDSRYVFWLDLMGARNSMKLSLPRAARSIMKIHAAALLAKQTYRQLEINPVMDGVYGYVKDRILLQSCLADILQRLAKVFVLENMPISRFMVRAGVAFGPLIPGASLAEGARILRQNKRYLGGTAIGMGISHAYEAESCAPPFGVYIHESARAFAPRKEGSEPFSSVFWRWFSENDVLAWAVKRTLLAHFEWLEKNPVGAQYDTEAMRRHKALAVEYFKLHELTACKP